MEIPSSSPNHAGFLAVFPKKLWSKLAVLSKTTKRVAKEDQRRGVHAVKVGVAVSLVSLFYYLHPLYGSLGDSAMWAVLTVVVMFEFSVGATLGKGVNRMIATCIGGGLAVGAHRLARLSGETGEPIILILLAFIVASTFTFLRFFPEMKARYDYGLMIFILTFSMVAVSGYRDDAVFPVAWKRLVTIIVGAFIAMMVCVFICPVWIGQDLHNLIASNLNAIAIFLEGFGGECFGESDEEKKVESDKSFLVKYKSILNTKSNEETMVAFARWEPRHGQFRFNHPWNQYLKIGTLARQCANKIEALSTRLNSVSQVQPEIREHFKKKCVRLSSECGKALKEVSSGMKKMKATSLQVKAHLKECKSASEELKSALESKSLESGGFRILDILKVGVVASMLIEIETNVKEILEAVQELDKLMHLRVVVAPEEDRGNGECVKERNFEKRDSCMDKKEGDGFVIVVINEGQDSLDSENRHL